MIDASIIVPVYNAEKYLTDSVRAMRDQTDANIEIILVDDGSTDGSPDLCARLAQEDSRIRVLRQSNSGPGIARNAGIDAARGDYIFFADADDKMAPTLIEETVAAARAAQADIVLFGSETVTFTREGAAHTAQRLPKRSGAFTYDEFWQSFDADFSMTLWVRLFRREYLTRNHLRFTNLRNGEDGLFILDSYSAGFSRAVLIQKPLYTYYHRMGSATLRFSQERSDAEYRIASRFEDVLESIPQTKGRFSFNIHRFCLTKLTIFITSLVSDDAVPKKEKRGLLKQFANRPAIKKALLDRRASASFGKTQMMKFMLLRLGCYSLVIRLAKPWRYH